MKVTKAMRVFTVKGLGFFLAATLCGGMQSAQAAENKPGINLGEHFSIMDDGLRRLDCEQAALQLYRCQLKERGEKPSEFDLSEQRFADEVVLEGSDPASNRSWVYKIKATKAGLHGSYFVTGMKRPGTFVLSLN